MLWHSCLRCSRHSAEEPVMNFMSTIPISDPKLRQTKTTQTDWLKQWRSGHVPRKSLPSVSWPRQVDSSSSRGRYRSPVPIILGHLTQLCDSGPIKCLLTIFTTTFQQAATCRHKKETAHKHRSVTSSHPWLCSMQHLKQRLSATSFQRRCATTETHSRGHVECKEADCALPLQNNLISDLCACALKEKFVSQGLLPQSKA